MDQRSSLKTPPVGSELTMQQLLEAALWKVDSEPVAEDGGQLFVPFDSTSNDHLVSTYDPNIGIIHSTQRLLAQLSWRHNSTTTINCLPVEILTLILHITQKTCRLESDAHLFPSKYPDRSCLRTLTAVCRHWRGIALSNPSFWREIWIDNDTNIPTLFWHRSRPLPARITFHNRTSAGVDMPELDPRFLSLLGQNTQRIEGLSIYSSTFRDLRIFGISNLLRNTFSNLQVLLIDCEHKWPHKVISDLVSPKLKHLSLSGICSLDPQLFRGLTSLSLYLHATYLPDVPKFIDVLRLSPGLRIFRFDANCPTERLLLHEYQDVRPLSLSSIQEINITNRYEIEPNPFFPLHKLIFPLSTYVEWNGLCFLPKSSILPQPTFLNRMMTLLLSAEDSRHKAHFDLILLHWKFFRRFYLPNIRILILHKSMVENHDYLFRWADSFPFVEECHIPAACATVDFLVSLDQSDLHYYPHLTTLDIWLDGSDNIKNLFNVSSYIQSSPKYRRIQELALELAETGAAFWLGLDESRCCMINIRHAKDLVDMEVLSWEWMIAQSMSRG
ncbi:hypothetical protein CPB83DRAFT_886883 [Crepidotus variabilis]|uniref:F-box domain-containing protein n=1 Tax=Crepidotus variabilis TaxID=179855 RepID=A0A9P6E6X2_9AGAR|nr:hypothetical protein CPB83DRAFT_886883 [Crepidotus variabilis]